MRRGRGGSIRGAYTDSRYRAEDAAIIIADDTNTNTSTSMSTNTSTNASTSMSTSMSTSRSMSAITNTRIVMSASGDFRTSQPRLYEDSGSARRGDWRYDRRGRRGRGRGTASPVYFKEKVSIGIACCRFYRGRPQVLMIQKRYTYAYSSFVHGAYEGGGDRAILALLNQMTVDEKIILQSLNFDIIWTHIWLTQNPHDTQKYRLMKNIFDAAFIYSGNNMRLHDLIARSVHGSRVWEIPKGRSRKGEADIHCAVREFYEETGIEKNQYYLYADATRTHTFIDDGVQYVQKYYIASTHRTIHPHVCLDSRVQIEEVADIRWMSIDDIRFVDQTGRLERLVRPIFNYVKKRTTTV